MERFGVRIAGQVPDTGHVARLAAPIIGLPVGDVTSELSRSGQLATALSREQADRLVGQLSDLGLEVFVDSMPDIDARAGAPRGNTDPLHGLASLRAVADADESSAMASALIFDEDDVSRPSIGTAPPAFMRPPPPTGIADDDEYDDDGEPKVGQTGVMFAPPQQFFKDALGSRPLLAAPDGAAARASDVHDGSDASKASLSAPPFEPDADDEIVLVKPPRVSPSQEVPLIRDPFESGPSQPGLPPPVTGAPPLAVLRGDDLSGSAGRQLHRPPPRKHRYGLLAVALLVVAIAIGAFMMLRGGDPARLLAQARDATAAGEYDRALFLVGEARKAGGTETALRPVLREAQAGPLLDSGEGHLAAGAWDKARATFEAARALAPGSARAVGLVLKLERLSASEPKAPATIAAAVAVPKPVADVQPPSAAAPPAPGTVAPASEPMRPAPPATSAVAEASAAEADEPRASGRLARLLVRAPVRARIYVDGRSTGQLTPATIRLPPGDHDFELRDERSGRVLASRSVRAVSGRAARVNFRNLAADPAPRPARSPEAARKAPAARLGAAEPKRVEMIGAPAAVDRQPANGGSRVELIGQ